MTFEPSMLAVEERLQRLASEMPAPDMDAGWRALSAKLQPPLAQVIPLPRKSFGRPITLAAAAALLVAGSAFAAVTHGGSDAPHVAPVVPVELPDVASSGAHLHGPFTGPPVAPTETADDPAKGPSGDTSSTGGASGSGSTGTDGTGDGTDRTGPKDDPDDLDQGTGNDGRHDDQGGGNDGTEGSQERSQGH